MADIKKKTAEPTTPKPEAEAAPVIPWAIQWPDMKICIAPRLEFDRMKPEQQEKLRADYGDGLVLLDWIKARRLDEMGLLVMERSTWEKLPEDIREKLRATYGENDGLRVFADGFLTLTNTKDYPTSQRGNALAFCKLRGRDYIHTTKPAAGYHWEKLETDKDGHSGGYWAADDADTWLRAALNKLTDDLWQMYLAVRIDDDKNKKSSKRGDPATTATDDELRRAAREDLLAKWKHTIRDRYDSFANYEMDKIAARIKAIKDEDGVKMNDPDRCAGLLPCLNGIYELDTGNFRSACPDDHMSYYVPTFYDSTAYDQKVRDALDLFFDSAKDKDRAEKVEGYFFELLGTGLYPVLRKDTKAMVQLIGPATNNGKSTLVRALMACLGDADGTGLAQSVRPEAFAKIAGANTSTLTPDFATIGWARLIFVSEPDENLRINWAQVKDLSSAGWLKINPKNAPVYKIPAQFLMFWDTNFYLRVDDPTLFSRGTMKLVPFDHIFKEANRDPEIDKKLSTPTARSYLLRLMLEGLRRYLKQGFSAPAICQKMVADYEQSSDKLGEFLDQNFIKTGKISDKIMLKKEAYPRYVEWCSANGYKGVESFGEFVRKLKNRPGVIIGSRNNAQTLDGYLFPENVPTKTDPFDGLDPLVWYLKNYTAENPPEGGKSEYGDPWEDDLEQMKLDGPPEPLTPPAPPLTLEELRQDYSRRTFEKDNFRQPLDAFRLLSALLEMGWEMKLANGNVGQSVILGHHIMTPKELENREREGRQKQFQILQAGVREHLENIKNEEDRSAIRRLLRSGALGEFLKNEPTAYAEIFRSVILDGAPLEVALGTQTDKLLKMKNGGK